MVELVLSTNPRRVYTLKDAARDAIAVQDACNLSGVEETFHQVIRLLRLCNEKERWGTDVINRHPIVVLFTSKLYIMARGNCIDMDLSAYSKAYHDCKCIINGGKEKLFHHECD